MPKLSFDLLQQEIDYVIKNNDFQGAFEAYNLVKKWLEKSGPVKNSSEYVQYNNYLMKLKLLSFNFLSDINERIDLLKNYFGLSFEIDQFDLWGKIETELISISSLDARDDFKKRMREALENCTNVLINRQKYVNQEMPREVSEWTKNFVANLGLDQFDKLKKMEYLSNNKFIKLLDAQDKDKVKVLLNIYEKLRISSQTREGYENPVLMNIDGKSIIFDHGNVEEISDLDKIKSIDMGDGQGTSKPSDFSDDLFLPDKPKSQSGASSAQSQATPAQPEIKPLSPLEELEQTLKNYSESSFEHKALRQEISRLKKSELTKAQYDAKK